MARLGRALTCSLLFAAFACGDDDGEPPITTPIAGSDGGGSGGGSGGTAGRSNGDGGTPTDGGPNAMCLRATGFGKLNTPEGDRVTGRVEAALPVVTSDFTQEGAVGTLRLELIGGERDIDAGIGEFSYALELSVTALPEGLVRQGDTLDVVYETNDGVSGSSDTLIASRDGALVFFAASNTEVPVDRESLMPALDPYGVTITADDDVICETAMDPNPSCKVRQHALRASYGEESGSASQTGLVRAGDLTVAGSLLEALPNNASTCELWGRALNAAGFVKRP